MLICTDLSSDCESFPFSDLCMSVAFAAGIDLDFVDDTGIENDLVCPGEDLLRYFGAAWVPDIMNSILQPSSRETRADGFKSFAYRLDSK